ETVPSGAVDGKKDGITYDGSKHIVVVTVEDNDKGALVVSDVKYDGADSITITNIVEKGSLTVVKTWQGDDIGEEAKAKLSITIKGKDIGGKGVDTKTITYTDLPYTAEGLLVGEKYTVEETNAGTLNALYDLVAAESTQKVENVEITEAGVTAELINKYERKTGDLTISKTVVSPIPAEETKEFSFTVLLSEKISGEFAVTGGTEGEKITFTNGSGTISVKGKQTKTITGLPQGVTYTVVEAVDNLFKADKQQLSGTVSTTASTAAFENTRKTGNLEVKKTVVSSNAADKETEFSFKVTLSDTTITGTFGDMSFDKGVAEFMLKNGEVKTATGLPTGVTYTVTEAADAGFATTSTGETGTICLAKATAAFTNTRSEGGLVVSKKVVSAIAEDHTKDFTVTVTLDDKTIKGSFGDATFDKGVATLTLKDGDVKVINGLPNGMGYEVAETLAGDDGNIYTVTYSGKTGTIQKDKTQSALVTNTRKTTELTVSKEVVSGIASDKTDETFLFTVTFTPAITGEYSGVYVENGTVQLQLKHNQTVTLKGIPYGTTYTVAEAEDTRFAKSVEGKETDKLTDKAATVKFTNIRKTGDLEISKTVISPIPAERTAEYHFEILLNDKISGTFGGVAFTDGKAAVTVKGGETKAITGLPAGVKYTVIEAVPNTFTAAPNSAEGTIGTETAKAAFTNTRKTGDLEVKKTVISSNAADKTKEFSFKVKLNDEIISGTFGDMTFNAGVARFTLADGQSKKATGLPTGVTYTVEEAAADGFVTTKTGESGTICLAKAIAAFTNTKSEGGLVVSKKVISAVASDHSKEFTVKVTLADKTINGTFGDAVFANGVATLTLKDGDVKVINGLPNGMGYEVAETLTGDDGSIYTVKYSGKTGTIQKDKTQSALVTNTRKTTELTVSKKVVSPVEGDLKEAFQFTLKFTPAITGEYSGVYVENGEAKLWLKHNQSITLTGIPYGTTYKVSEEASDKYSTTVNGSETGELKDASATVVYTNTAEYTKTNVEKVWVDGDDKHGMRPESIEVLLIADTVDAGESKKVVIGSEILSSSNNWKVSRENLPKFKDGKPITYEWREASVPAGYKSEVKDNVITNTLLTGKLIVRKTATGLDATQANKVYSFTITSADGKYLHSDGTLSSAPKTYEVISGESVTIQDVPFGVYFVTENVDNAQVAKYTLAATQEGNGAIDQDQTEATITLKNDYTQDKGNLAVKKVVVGAPAGTDKTFEFTVKAEDGRYVQDTNGTLGKDEHKFQIKNNETVAIAKLPVGTYTVTETNKDGDAKIENYSLAVTGEGDVKVENGATASVTIVNSYTNTTNNLTIVKRFVGLPANANTAALQFRIEGPTGFTARTVYYSDFANNGSYTLTNVPTGTYSVTELNAGTLVDGYYLNNAQSTTSGTATLTGRNSAVIVLTNTYGPEAASLIISKTFNYQGDGNVDKASELKLQFRITGPNNFSTDVTYSGAPITVTVPGPGTYAVYETNANALNAAWTLLGTSVTAGSVDVVAGNVAPTINLTNNYEVATTSVAVAKIWSDMDDLDESRPESLTMTLSNGMTVELNEANKWTAEIKDLPLFDAAGQTITYTWTEPPVPGYTMTGMLVLGNLTVFTNTHIPELTSVSVSKIWQDNDNASHMRPATLRVTLSDGQSVILSEANGWAATIKNLPVYKHGEKVDYTWSEQEVLGYTQTSVIITDDMTVFTNTYRHRPPPPPDTPVPPNVPGEPLIEIEDYGTPLGIEVIINHVGDCFD
ncbi:MAG: Cna B-type domain-containing protein, partial [Oscillospiraceae bacterium]|nr:Cna B-type domain-containing protein [Oscillospiraceae bacterium]